MAFSLTRNAKLYVSTVTSGFSAANTWQVEVLDGFSFPANVTTQEITVSEAGTDPIRGQQAFVTSIDPVDWSFSAYVRPYDNTTEIVAPELVLWNAMAAPGAIDAADGGVTTGTLSTAIDFESSNKNQIQLLQLYFDLGGGQWYHIEDAVVNTAEFDFGIDQIAMIAWSGQAKIVNKIADPSLTFTAVPATANFLQNKLTVVDAVDLGPALIHPSVSNGDVDTVAGLPSTISSGTTTFLAADVGDYVNITAGGAQSVELGYYKITAVNGGVATLDTELIASSGPDVTFEVRKGYDLALTGGNLTVTNNITYLTPESLGVVNRPITHFTGTRGVSGSMTCYLKTGAAGTDSGSADLFNNLSTDTATVTQDFRLQFTIGGTKAAATRIEFELPHAHINIPVIDVQDVISVTVDYVGLPHNGTEFDLESKNELVVEYYGETL